MKKYSFLLLLFLLALAGCSATKKIPKGLYYDPPGSTITTNKIITPEHKRTITINSSGISESNEFDGARLNDFFQVNDTLYQAEMEPENAPVNNSAWYSFKVWSTKPQTVWINLKYKDGSHRYHPKTSRDGLNWKPLDSTFYKIDTAAGSALLKLNVDKDTLWISGQELMTSKDYENWINKILENSFAKKKIIGYSSLGKPINELEISEASDSVDYIVLTGRQHPPEVTGAFALLSFVETITGDSETAKEFRKKFKIYVIPLMNPDGVDAGNWRHNIHGVDLNRDWYYFNQPETRAVKDEMLRLKNLSGKMKFFIDFHSTQKDVFYISKSDSLNNSVPPEIRLAHERAYHLTKDWFAQIGKSFPEYYINIDESLNNPNSPTSDEWIYNNFYCPALTYEMGDEDNRGQIKKLASIAATELMKLLLNEK
ncbi:MAG: M14 family metallopeptidase [Bacteroidetes bacterium]|nr:M14 family metallopeptidase [Bacteroidota bacterium]